MIDIIYNMPSILLFILICTFSIVFSIFSLLLVDKYLPITFRAHENEGLVIVSAIVGIIYAMLVGFTILYELENFNKADRAEKDEARIIYSIYRQSISLPEPGASKIQDEMKQYAQVVIHEEWPAMMYGKPVAETGDNIIQTVYKDIHSFSTVTEAQQKTLDALAVDNSTLFQIHEERTDSRHDAALTPNLWLVLILGSILTLSINFLIGMEFRMHLLCVVVIALMISAVIYLIITLDQPYRSDFSVSPTTIENTLKYFSHSTLT